MIELPKGKPWTVESFAEGIDVSWDKISREIKYAPAFGDMLAASVDVVKPKRGGAWAGNALTRKNKIIINQKLFECGTLEDVQDTFRHECAHILTDHLYQASCHHDSRWKLIAKMLGDDGDRYHDYEYLRSKKRNRPYSYYCTGCSNTWQTARRLKNDGQFHTCRSCGGQLRPVSPGVETFLELEKQVKSNTELSISKPMEQAK